MKLSSFGLLVAGIALVLTMVACAGESVGSTPTEEVKAPALAKSTFEATAQVMSPATSVPPTPLLQSGRISTTPITTESAPTKTESTQEFGTSGLIADLESWATIKLPDFISASHIDVGDIAFVSKFRSQAGHDFSDSFMTCCSMKHYFLTTDYYATRFTQPIYSMVDGVVLYLGTPFGGPGGAAYLDERVGYEAMTGEKPPADYRDWNIYIRPDDAPNVWIEHKHVNPLDEIVEAVPPTNTVDMMRGILKPATVGYRVKAGDLIAHGVGEIIVKRYLDGSGFPSPCNSGDVRKLSGNRPGCQDAVELHSIFEFMTDSVFAEFQKVANVSRADFIITAEERAANPLQCDGEQFTEPATVDDPVHYIRLQDSITTVGKPPDYYTSEEGGATETDKTASAPESTQVLPGFSALSSGRETIAFFAASGSQLSTFDTDRPYGLVIASEGGPFEISINVGTDQQRVYSRPSSTGVSIYETGTLETLGHIEISAQAGDDISWQIVVIKAN